MCYSAQAIQDHKKYRRNGGKLGIKEYLKFFWDWRNGSPYAITKAMMDAFDDATEGDERQIREWIEAWKAERVAATEQELFGLHKRLADAERSLQVKETKKAQNDQRIATSKIDKALLRLSDLRRTDPLPRDSRFFPGNYSAVMVSEGGERLVYPMRYGCRPAGKPSVNDQRFPGTYNARRDSLECWRSLKTDHPCAFKIDQGMSPGDESPGMG